MNKNCRNPSYSPFQFPLRRSRVDDKISCQVWLRMFFKIGTDFEDISRLDNFGIPENVEDPKLVSGLGWNYCIIFIHCNLISNELCYFRWNLVNSIICVYNLWRLFWCIHQDCKYFVRSSYKTEDRTLYVFEPHRRSITSTLWVCIYECTCSFRKIKFIIDSECRIERVETVISNYDRLLGF